MRTNSSGVGVATLSIVAAGLICTLDAAAHHSTGLFDGTRIATIEGRVTRVAWRSPHIYVFVEGNEQGGEPGEWRFESVPVPIMVRQGWTEDSLHVGDRVTVEGYPHRDGNEKYAWIYRVIKEDGTVLDPGPIGSPGGVEGPGGVFQRAPLQQAR